MRHSYHPALRTNRPGGRLLTVCLILILLAAWLTPAAAMAQANHQRETEETRQTTPAHPPNGLLCVDDALDLGSGDQTLTSDPRETARFAPTTPQDLGWAAGFNQPAMNDWVLALTVGPNGSLYTGGFFTSAGGVAANRIARWDGMTWYPLGSGIMGGDYLGVFALAFGPDGSLYAGGSFTTAGGVAANNIARWDGTAWYPLGSGMDDAEYPIVRALAFGPDGSLYAGGGFTSAGGVAVNNIARWDGTAWHPLGSGADHLVQALAFGSDGSLFTGGRFTTAGGVVVNSITRWDGSQWHPLGSGTDGVVYALAVALDGSLYAGGYFFTAGGTAANHIARWDGSQWHPLASGTNDTVFALAIALDGSLYAGGAFPTAGGTPANSIARWDGYQWHSLATGMSGGAYGNATVDTLAVASDGSVYVGGNFTTAGSVAANYIARWDGFHWRPVDLGNGMNSAVRALVVGPGGSTLYAGGNFNTAGGVVANRIARWDGMTWHPLGSGVCCTYEPHVRSLALGLDGSLYAGGDFGEAGGVAAYYIARWDGTTWHPMGSGMVGPVDALAVGPDGSLYAGGWFDSIGSMAIYRIARWDGMAWHALGSGMNYGVVALAFGPDGSLYAGGYFTTAGGVAANRIARWDQATSSWHPLSSGMDGEVRALTFGPDGSLYAGGWFGTAGGVEAHRIARWDGSLWHPLGSGMDNGVYALTFGPDGSLYAGGNFYDAGGVYASYIARWDGALWHPLRSGMNGEVRALAVMADGSLYTGGQFTTAGGAPSSFIARWGELPPTAVSLMSFEAVADHSVAASALLVTAVLGLAMAAGAAFAQRSITTQRATS